LPSSVGANGNSVIAIDPTTGVESASAFAGSEPATLALSDDGQFLYVALTGTNAIQRFALPALTTDLKIQLGRDATFGSLYAGDLKVVPGAAHSLIVAQTDQAGYNTFAVTAYDDATARAVTTQSSAIYTSINTLEWGASPSVLYGAGTMNLAAYTAIATLHVDPTGVSVVSATQDGALARIHYYGGLIYTDGGNVMDPASGAFVGTCPTNLGNYQGTAAVIDPATQTLFTLWSDSSGTLITASRLPGCTLIASARIGGVVLSPYVTPRLVRFGTNGLAFLSHDGKLFTLQGAFVTL
jgi:DNA-binding beta-propeller fold protein YncE